MLCESPVDVYLGHRVEVQRPQRPVAHLPQGEGGGEEEREEREKQTHKEREERGEREKETDRAI